MNCRRTLAWLGAGLAIAVPALAQPPSLIVKTGRAGPHGPKYLEQRDGKYIGIGSEQVLQSHILECTVRLPVAEVPEQVASASIALAASGNAAHPIRASVWLPHARIWQPLETRYVPTDPKGFITYELPHAAKILAADRVELLLRIEEHSTPAKPIAFNVDAAKLMIKAKPKEAVDAHAAAARAGDDGPVIRVHSFAGASSNSYDAKRNAISKKFREPPPPKPKKKAKKKKKKGRR